MLLNTFENIGGEFLFFLLPFAFGSIVGILILIASILLRKSRKPSNSKIPTYLGILMGIGTIVYSIQEIRGFEGAFVGLIGLTIIIESLIISSLKKEKNLST